MRESENPVLSVWLNCDDDDDDDDDTKVVTFDNPKNLYEQICHW